LRRISRDDGPIHAMNGNAGMLLVSGGEAVVDVVVGLLVTAAIAAGGLGWLITRDHRVAGSMAIARHRPRPGAGPQHPAARPRLPLHVAFESGAVHRDRAFPCREHGDDLCPHAVVKLDRPELGQDRGEPRL
jgi:hypothetical protein